MITSTLGAWIAGSIFLAFLLVLLPLGISWCNRERRAHADRWNSFPWDSQ